MATPTIDPVVQEETDIFKDINSGKFPTNIRQILSSQGKNPAAMEKQFESAIQSGGQTKADAVMGYYKMFDEIGGTNKYQSVIDSYQRAAQRQTPATPTAKETDPIAPVINQPAATPKESETANDVGAVGSLFKNLANTFVIETAKGAALGLLSFQVLRSDEEKTKLTDGTPVIEKEEIILPTDSMARKSLKMHNNLRINADNTYRERAKSVSKWFDELKFEVPKETPVFYDKEKGELNLDNISNVRAWSGLIGNTMGSALPSYLIAAVTARASKGKNPAAAKALANTARGISFVTSTAQMFPGYLDEAIDNGFTYSQATKIAGSVAVINGAIELVGMEYAMRKFGYGKDAAKVAVRDVMNSAAKTAIRQLARKEITTEVFLDVVKASAQSAFKSIGNKAFMEGVKPAAKRIAAEFGKNALVESAEEGLQSAIETSGKTIANRYAASKESKPGAGQYDISSGEEWTNGVMGMLMGGLVGGMGSLAYRTPSVGDQSMFSYANTDIRQQIGQGTESIADVKANGKIFNKINQWAEEGQFNYKDKNGVEKFDQGAFDQVVKNANMMYDTAWEFKDFENFSDLDRFDMFRIAKTRDQLSTEGQELGQTLEQVKQLDDQINNYDAVQPDESGYKPSLGALELQRAKIAKDLGRFDEANGVFEKQASFSDKSSRMENIIKQAVPAINEESTRRVARSFLTNGVSSLEKMSDPATDDFLPHQQITLNDGTIAVVDNPDPDSNMEVRELIIEPIAGSSALSHLSDPGKYKPIERFDHRTAPIESFPKFQEIVTKRPEKLGKSTLSPYSIKADVEEVLGYGANIAQQTDLNPDDVKAQVDKAYDLYDEISNHKGAIDEGVPVVTKKEFYGLIGYKTDGAEEVAIEAPATESSTDTAAAPAEGNANKSQVSNIEDPQADTILAKQKQLGRDFSVEDEYTATDPTVETIQQISDGNEAVPIEDIDYSTNELLNLRKKWVARRNVTNREYTLPQINEMVAAIESDLEILQNEKSYQQAPELRPQKVEPENTETNGEDTNGQGDQVDTEVAPSIESEYIEERERGQTISDIEKSKGDIRPDAGSVQLGSEVSTESDTGQESVNRVTEQIEQRNASFGSEFDSSEESFNQLSEVPVSEPGDSSASEAGTTPSEGDTIVVKAKKKGIRKDQRKIKDPERLQALAKEPNNIYDEVAQYFVGNGQVNTKDVNKLFNGTGNTERQNMISSTADYGPTIDQLAHRLWEDSNFPGKHETSDYKDAIESLILAYPGIQQLTANLNKVAQQEIDPDFIPGQSDKGFDLNGVSEFFHASPKKRNGRLKVSTAPQFGAGVYFSTNEQLVKDEFGENITQVSLAIENPVYTNTPQWIEVQKQAIADADTAYGKRTGEQMDEEQGYFRYDPNNLSEVDEIPANFISDAAKALGYDAIIDKGSSTYENEIIVLDESKIIYPEDVFAENVTKSQEDDDYVPFSFNSANGSNQILPVLNTLAKAFPNINLNIPSTIGEFNAVVESLPGAREIISKGGVAYGLLNPKDGSIYLNPSVLAGNANTPIHEYGHVWVVNAKQNNPELYKQGAQLAKTSPYFKNLGPEYKNLSEEQRIDEALATAIGDKGEQFLTTTKKSMFREWMDKLFSGVKKFFGIPNSSPKQISDMSFEDFTNSVVADLLSGESISEISSDQVRDILKSAGQSDETIDLMQNDPDPSFSWKTPIAPGSLPGEKVGSAADFKAEAITALGPLVNQNPKTTPYTDADKTLIKQVHRETGWELIGKDKWSADMSVAAKNDWYFVDGKLSLIPSKTKSSKDRGRIAKTYMNGVDAMFDQNSFLGSVAKRLMGSVKDGGLFTQSALNIESIVEMIDDENGLMKQLIYDEKRAGESRMNEATNAIMEPYLNYQKAMAKFSTYKGASNQSTVGKVEISVIVNDQANGKLVEKKVWVPTAVAMNLARTEKTQRAMGDEYMTKGSVAAGTAETHSSLVLDDAHFNAAGKLINPNDNSKLFNKAGEQKGITFLTSEIEELDASGNYGKFKNADGKETDVIQVIFSNKEIDKLINRFDNGVGAVEGEVDAFKAGDTFYNNQKVQDMLAKENDEFLNPDRPFKKVPYYVPLANKVNVLADQKMNSFSPNLEDSKRLHERTERPDHLYIQDDLKMAKYYMDAVSMVLGSGRLVHNLKNIQNALTKETEGQEYTKEIVTYIQQYSEDLQNFQQKRALTLGNNGLVRMLNSLMSSNTAFVFRGNLGIALTQPSAFINAYGQGIIEGKYLTKATKSLAKYGLGGLWDSFAFAGTTINSTTGQGDKTAIGTTTFEKGMLEYLFGEHITNPVEKEKFDKDFATLKGRALYGNSMYVEGVSFDSSVLTLGGLKGQAIQATKKLDDFLEEYTMGPIRRLDRAVIFSFIEAAKLQATDEIDSGTIKAKDFDSRVAELATAVLYSTNQMNSLLDTTQLQRTPNPIVRIITMYSGQTQKLFNQLHQSMVGYLKYGSKATTPDDVQDRYKTKLTASLISNLILVPAWVAGSRIIWQTIKSLTKGEEPDNDEVASDFFFDWLRGFSSIIPGGTEQVTSTLISLFDNKKWTQGILEVPGVDIIENAVGSFGAIANTMMDSDKQVSEKQINQAMKASSKLMAMCLGIPKTWYDIGLAWATDEPVKKGAKPVQQYEGANDDEEFGEDGFEDAFND